MPIAIIDRDGPRGSERGTDTSGYDRTKIRITDGQALTGCIAVVGKDTTSGPTEAGRDDQGRTYR